jgi:hypothetical protein
MDFFAALVVTLALLMLGGEAANEGNLRMKLNDFFVMTDRDMNKMMKPERGELIIGDL